MPTITITRAQRFVLDACASSARCVGSKRTELQHGYVHTATARSLAAVGLVREEQGATDRWVFVMTDKGRAVLELLRENEGGYDDE